MEQVHSDTGAERILPAAIVGAGPAGLIAFVALRYRGLSFEDVTVFDPTSPLSAWTERTDAILQEEMRSESDGHLFPTDYPGFALLESIRDRNPLPLVRSAVNRYNPGRVVIQDHGHALARHYGIEKSMRRTRVARLVFESEPSPHTVLLDERGNVVGRARHVLLGLGHGPLRWPEVLADEAKRSELRPPLCHSYEAKEYGERTYLVVGNGMAAAAEWVNVLRSGGRVVALRRRADVLEQPLSAPRCYFGGPLLDRFHRMGREERRGLLQATARGSYPARADRKRILDAAEREGRIERRVGRLAALERDGTGLVVSVDGPDGTAQCRVDALIAATGFHSGWTAHSLLRDLVSSHGADTEEDFLVLNDDCTVCLPGVTGTTVSVSGPLARWIFPPADSFTGMKYVARRFADTVFGTRSGLAPGPLGWWRMVRAGMPRSSEMTPCASP